MTFIDVYRLSLARPELSFDGQHYVQGDDPLKDMVYVNIRRALLHVLCGASAR